MGQTALSSGIQALPYSVFTFLCPTRGDAHITRRKPTRLGSVFSRDPGAISPTAHYTAEVWQRNGLSDPALATWEGRALHLGLWPAMTVWGAIGNGTLDQALLARHRLID